MGSILDNIKNHINETGISQTQLAEMSGLSFGTINRILNGKQQLHPNTLHKIANGLGVSVEELDESRQQSFGYNVQGYLQFGDEITHITSYRSLQNWIAKYEPLIIGLPQQAKKIIKEERANAKRISKRSLNLADIDFHKVETIDATTTECWSFRKSEDEREGNPIDLGNMCVSYPFECCGRVFTNSEALYICGMFSGGSGTETAIQEELLQCKSGYDAKKDIRKKYERLGYVRKDWNTFNVEYMKWCVLQKVRGNADFRRMLLSIPTNAYIIENSTLQKGETAEFWGMRNHELEDKRSLIEQWVSYDCAGLNKKQIAARQMEERNKINHVGQWVGTNCMGKILKHIQLSLQSDSEPQIDYDLLRSKQIHLFGEVLNF